MSERLRGSGRWKVFVTEPEGGLRPVAASSRKGDLVLGQQLRPGILGSGSPVGVVLPRGRVQGVHNLTSGGRQQLLSELVGSIGRPQLNREVRDATMPYRSYVFAQEVRPFFEEREITQSEVAEATDWSVSKVNRLFNGEVFGSRTDLLALFNLLPNLTDERREQLLERYSRERGIIQKQRRAAKIAKRTR